MRPRGIIESVLYVDDLDLAEAFYSDVLGLERHSKQDGRQIFFRCGDGMLLLFNAAVTSVDGVRVGGARIPLHGSTGPGHLAFRATEEEIDQWKARLSAAGVAVTSEVTWPGGGRSIYFEDPAGNVLEFANPSLWSLPEA